MDQGPWGGELPPNFIVVRMGSFPGGDSNGLENLEFMSGQVSVRRGRTEVLVPTRRRNSQGQMGTLWFPGNEEGSIPHCQEVPVLCPDSMRGKNPGIAMGTWWSLFMLMPVPPCL